MKLQLKAVGFQGATARGHTLLLAGPDLCNTMSVNTGIHLWTMEALMLRKSAWGSRKALLRISTRNISLALGVSSLTLGFSICKVGSCFEKVAKARYVRYLGARRGLNSPLIMPSSSQYFHYNCMMAAVQSQQPSVTVGFLWAKPCAKLLMCMTAGPAQRGGEWGLFSVPNLRGCKKFTNHQKQYGFFLFGWFWLRLWYVEVPGPETEPEP